MKIILDTNFIIEMVERKISLENHLFLMPEEVTTELKAISEHSLDKKIKLKTSENASVALQLIKKSNGNNLKKIKLGEKHVDLGILHYIHKLSETEKRGTALATLDNNLIKKAKKQGVQTLDLDYFVKEKQ